MLIVVAHSMKKLLTILLLSLASCRSGQEELTISTIYPSSEIIDISGITNYSNLIKELETYDCTAQHNLLKFKDNYIPVQLGIYCLKGGNFVDFKERNFLRINDSTDFSQLSIENFILNNGNDPDLSESPYKAIIAINFSDSAKTANVIAKMTTVNKAYLAIWTRQAKIHFDKHLIELSDNELEELTMHMYPYRTTVLAP